MSLFSLNEDVLTLILEKLTSQDARQLLTTCRAGYDIAMPYSLRRVNFGKWSRLGQAARVERTRMFCEFMLADPARRIPCLRVLWVDGSAFAESITHRESGQIVWEPSHYSCPCHFTRVLRLATGLRQLGLWHMDALLAASDRDCLWDAFAALPALEVVHFDDQPRSRELLSNMISRPRSLHFRSGKGTWPHTSGVFSGKYLPRNIGEGLEALYFRGSAILAENLHHAGIILPRLRKLSIHLGYCASLASLAIVFPNLRTLQSLDVWFAENQLPAVWKGGLDRVRLSRDRPRTQRIPLPLASRIRRLELLTPVREPETPQSFATLLSDAKPTVLALTIVHNDVVPWMAEIARIAPGLKYLHLVLRSLDENIVMSCATALGGIALSGISFGYGSDAPVIHDAQWASSLTRKVGEYIPSVAYVGLNVQDYASGEYDDMHAITWHSIERAHSSQRTKLLSWWRAEQLVAELLSLDADHSQ